jgi:hypothetical protein
MKFFIPLTLRGFSALSWFNRFAPIRVFRGRRSHLHQLARSGLGWRRIKMINFDNLSKPIHWKCLRHKGLRFLTILKNYQKLSFSHKLAGRSRLREIGSL